MNIFKHCLTHYRCIRCDLGYTATPETEKQVLHGVCWACTFVESLSYSQQDWMLLGFAEQMEDIDFRGQS